MNGLRKYLLEPLTFIGALNWGLIGLFRFDLVAWIFGPGTMVSRVIYAAIGIAAAVWVAMIFVKDNK
ncbi:DUF378 domain-containing protein [Lachnospiraceae bacterium OttesenSCG-928-E19]|nr:DUF378 domain-containing protein [Lachnospiraceae bacterium OttesenSCG-928-E19]